MRKIQVWREERSGCKWKDRNLEKYNQHSPFCIHILTKYVFHEGEGPFVLAVFSSLKQCLCSRLPALLQKRVLHWLKPPTTSLVLGTFTDLTRGRAELLAEHALLRQQLIVLHRQVKRPVYWKRDRLLLVILARMVRTWKQALFLVQPETLLRWHRELFRLFWKHTSKPHARKPRLSRRVDHLGKAKWQQIIGFGESPFPC